MKKVPSLKFLWIATVWDEAQNGTLTNASSGPGPQAALWHAGVVVAQSRRQSRRIPLIPRQAPAAGPAQLLRASKSSP